MNITDREFWTLVHGMGFGAMYLLAFAGGVAGLYSFSSKLVTPEGISERMMRLRWGTIAMAGLVWLTVIVGTYVVYPWYRADPTKIANSTIDTKTQNDALRQYPKFWLIASDQTAAWHTFGMEFKEHVAWLAPLLATVVAFAVFRYNSTLANYPEARRMIIAFFIISFALAGIAGLLGALITKASPVL
jgi:hypothetical protein